jgi:transcriptional regulator with XRE-family HTH domain
MKLKEYLELKNYSAMEFAEIADVNKLTIRNILHGISPNLQSATKIELASNGEVTCKELLSQEILESITKRLLLDSTFHKPSSDAKTKARPTSKFIKKKL